MSDQPPKVLARRYQPVRLLGEGGMGRVWEARDELLGRDVAIKEIAPGGLSSTELGDLRERAIREARAIAKVSHPNVVRIFDVVSDHGAPWIVMELVPSRSLLTVINDEGPMDPQRVARIGLEVLAALEAAHRAGILHRDVKPANVLLTNEDRAVLTDFGLAAVTGDSGMTNTGVVVGSPSYLAPERALDEPARPASDLWSLGATLFAAVEGRPPYGKSSPMATLASLMLDPPAAPQQAGVLRPALEALLRKDPSQRADADEAERLLRDASDGLKRPAAPTGEPPKEPRRRSRLIAGGVVVVAAAATAIVFTNRTLHGPATRAAQQIAMPSSVSSDPPGSPAADSSPGIPQPGSAPASKLPDRGPASPTVPTTATASATKGASVVVKPVTRTLAAVFNNVAITDDAHTTNGNFDGGGASYSAQAFTDVGVTPGRSVTVDGVALVWPKTAGTGRKDNAIATGQTIGVPGSGRKLAFLVSGSYGTAAANGRITYTDGSSQTYKLAAPDWDETENPAATIIAPYQSRSDEGRYDQPAAVFGLTVTLTAGKTVAAVRLPAAGTLPVQEGITTMHVFAVGIG